MFIELHLYTAREQLDESVFSHCIVSWIMKVGGAVCKLCHSCRSPGGGVYVWGGGAH